MLHFDRDGELRRRFLLSALQRNRNPQVRLRALQEIAAGRDADAFDTAVDMIGGWPRDERREGVKIMLLALAERRIGRRDQANAWIWRMAEYTREVHEEYAVQRMAGDQAAARACSSTPAAPRTRATRAGSCTPRARRTGACRRRCWRRRSRTRRRPRRRCAARARGWPASRRRSRGSCCATSRRAGAARHRRRRRPGEAAPRALGAGGRRGGGAGNGDELSELDLELDEAVVELDGGLDLDGSVVELDVDDDLDEIRAANRSIVGAGSLAGLPMTTSDAVATTITPSTRDS